jgi:hypothetical protein
MNGINTDAIIIYIYFLQHFIHSFHSFILFFLKEKKNKIKNVYIDFLFKGELLTIYKYTYNR